MSKEIKNHFELKEVCRRATSYFVGSFTLHLLMKRKEWENPETKTQFIKEFHEDCFGWDETCTLERTRNRVNCVIRIIESHRVEDALRYVLDANDLKLNIPEAKECAQYTLDLIESGKLKY